MDAVEQKKKNGVGGRWGGGGGGGAESPAESGERAAPKHQKMPTETWRVAGDRVEESEPPARGDDGCSLTLAKGKEEQTSAPKKTVATKTDHTWPSSEQSLWAKNRYQKRTRGGRVQKQRRRREQKAAAGEQAKISQRGENPKTVNKENGTKRGRGLRRPSLCYCREGKVKKPSDRERAQN